MSSNKPVEIHPSHQNERRSKINFEAILESMKMRLAFPWADNDYGIDGQVELISPIKDLASHKPDSKFFLVQLKSIELLKVTGKNISYSLPVNKIIQWFSANLPVLLVLNDLKENIFFSIWIDDGLINRIERLNPNWVNRGSITIKIPLESKFDNNSSERLKDYVFNWKIPGKKIIHPGTYFGLKDKCKSNLTSYQEIIKPFNFGSSNNSLELLNEQIEQAIYRIAITGPSRVGKSTLINALLKRQGASPTGLFQTTGVPIQFLPGKEDMVSIAFSNGKVVTKKFSPENIEQYASQDMNPDNKKLVSIISVHLANQQLEHGVSLFDIPGLDDPDENIYNYTINTISKANAILYLIDASPFENGGYIFRNEYRKHILEFGQSLDKIFLVFTKTNALTGNKLELLNERIIADLKKLQLFEKVSGKVYFISAEESLEIRINNKTGNDSVQKLEDEIWAYLLKENKIGLANLSFVNKEINTALVDFESILTARLLVDGERIKLESALETLKTKIPELVNIYFGKERENKNAITNSLENRKNRILLQLEEHLKSFPDTEELPAKKDLQKFLTVGCHKSMEETNKEYLFQVNQQGQVINNWIEENLKLVREIIGGKTKQKIIDLTEIENFEPPPIDISSSVGVGIFTGLIALIVTPSLAVLAGVTAFFSNLVLSASELITKRIVKIMEEARSRYDKQFQKIIIAYINSTDENSKRIISHANKKITLYYTDLQEQTGKLGAKLTKKEEKEFKEAKENIENLKMKLIRLEKEINGLYSAI